MVYINEFLPNPVGADAAGEFVELYNDSGVVVSLAGWKLGVGTASTTSVIPAKTKPFSLAGFSVPAHGYLVLPRAKTKLSLKNVDGGLLLYGLDGKVTDRATFLGTAPEGKSFSRIKSNNLVVGHFAFTSSTPGAANAQFDTMIAVNTYPIGVPLNTRSSAASIISSPGIFTLGTALIITIIFFYAFSQNENLSNLLFGRDEPFG